MAWRHWGKSLFLIVYLQSHRQRAYLLSNSGCVTPAILKNMKEKLNGADDIDGYEDLSSEDQKKVQTAWDEGHGGFLIQALLEDSNNCFGVYSTDMG